VKNSLHKILSDLQEEGLISNTVERVAEIDALVDKESVPDGFEVDQSGVWCLQTKTNSPAERVWLSASLRVIAYTRDHKNENHGRVLQFEDIDGQRHEWTMPMELTVEPAKVLGALLNMGLRIAQPKKERDLLLMYITQSNPIRRTRCVLQCGWFNGAFVLPSRTIGYIQEERIIYHNPAAGESKHDQAGTLADWKSEVAKMACGNSRLILSISAAFTGPLLDLMNHENIGIHYRGNSSLGKSTAEYVGNSVWGNSSGVRTFRATANGLEGIASLHNDRLLCLDELGQISPMEAGQVIYMLGNGAGKTRSTQHGLAKPQALWRLVFLSTGELSLAQLMNEVGKRVKAGQEVRFIEVPADTGIHGLFESLHGFEGGSDFSMHLRESSARLYGTASIAFLEWLVEDIDGAIDMVKTIVNGLKQRYLPKAASAQVIRVFNHLALIAAAGELASQFGVTGWKTEEAISGVIKCFQDWLNARGDMGMHEEKEALTQVRSYFEFHGESRFTPWELGLEDKSRTINRVGYRKFADVGVEFYVFPDAFRNEICKGLDYRFVEKICIKQKLLLPATDGSPTRGERLPGIEKNKRCYRFTSEVLSGEKE
jgi:putative DNA primase/helicase